MPVYQKYISRMYEPEGLTSSEITYRNGIIRQPAVDVQSNAIVASRMEMLAENRIGACHRV